MTGNPKELDVIFDKMGYTKNTDFRKEAIRLITDWHNKQAEEVTRFEVIDDIGRAYTSRDVSIKLSYQDDGRTLKVFVNKLKEEYDGKKQGEGSPSRAG